MRLFLFPAAGKLKHCPKNSIYKKRRNASQAKKASHFIGSKGYEISGNAQHPCHPYIKQFYQNLVSRNLLNKQSTCEFNPHC